ncbi:MAG: hypothetical protein JST51_01470 [Armatimonadetes bacterium]|nr:hypothetical protein [Armatimonadota bacterium]
MDNGSPKALDAVQEKPLSIVDDLLGSVAAPAPTFDVIVTSREEGEYTISKVIRFRSIGGKKNFDDLKKAAQKFTKSVVKGTIPAQHKDYAFKDDEASLAMCGSFGATCVGLFEVRTPIVEDGEETTLKASETKIGDLSSFDFMKICSQSPILFEHIKGEFNAGNYNTGAVQDAEIRDASKKK